MRYNDVRTQLKGVKLFDILFDNYRLSTWATLYTSLHETKDLLNYIIFKGQKYYIAVSTKEICKEIDYDAWIRNCEEEIS